jgi:hypothetical protein
VNVENYQGKGPETIVVAMYGQPSGDTIPAVASKTSETISMSGLSLAAKQTDNDVTYIQSMSSNNSTWITLVIALAAGIAGIYIGLTHTRALHRVIRRSERYIIKHPLLDLTVLAFIALSVVLLQNVGRIY